jgi:hypothetical protein
VANAQKHKAIDEEINELKKQKVAPLRRSGIEGTPVTFGANENLPFKF